MSRLLGILCAAASAVVVLYFFPAIKEAYDSIYTNVLEGLGMELTTLQETVLEFLPYTILPMIVIFVFYKIFAGHRGGGEE